MSKDSKTFTVTVCPRSLFQDFLDTEYIQERSTTEVELRNNMRRLEDDYAAKMREREAMTVTRRVRTKHDI